jgi:hypothetical protein
MRMVEFSSTMTQILRSTKTLPGDSPTTRKEKSYEDVSCRAYVFPGFNADLMAYSRGQARK